MRYIECALTDLGYHVFAIDGPGEIWGLDNIADEFGDRRFEALPATGYPANALMCIDAPGDIKTKTMAILPDGAEPPEGGTEIAAADVVDLLLAEYGWPEGTTLVAGVPVAPERAR